MSGMVSQANVKRSVAMKARRNGKRARKAPEARLQESVCQYLALQERCGRLLWFHVPNSGQHHVSYRVKMKRLGLRAGVPDLCIIPKAGPVCFVELKAGKNAETEGQEAWLQKLPDYGCPVAVCRSLEEVQQFLFETGVIREVGA